MKSCMTIDVDTLTAAINTAWTPIEPYTTTNTAYVTTARLPDPWQTWATTTAPYRVDYDDILRHATVSNGMKGDIEPVYVYTIPSDLAKEVNRAGISQSQLNDMFIKFIRCMIEKKDEKDLAIAMKSSEQIFEFLDEYIFRDEAD